VELARTRALVLLVDDSATQAQRSSDALEAAGFRVRLAANGREALQDARRSRPDVIVSDVLMPVMDGFALCREVRREPALARVPIVLHTMTFLDPRDEEFALGLGATRFVLKPTDPADMVAEVRAALAAGPALIKVSPPASAVEDNAFLQDYNQRLAAKLEEKVAELEDAYHLLEQQSRQNELILGSVGEGIFGIDRQGRSTFVNAAAAQMAGYTPEELLGRPMHDLLQHSRLDGTPYPFDACPSHTVLSDGTVQRIQDEVFWRKDGTSFPVEYLGTPILDGGEIVGAVVTFTDITERRQAESLLQHQAWHDVLTGLPNRTRLRVELDQCMATQSTDTFALLLIDLDRFKEVNDTIGHPCGDLLLQQVGPRLRAELRERDSIARLGGDEFVVLLRGADSERASAVAARLLIALERPFELDGFGVAIGGSIGIALYPEHGVDADTLLREADIAMYAAKDARSGYTIYAPDTDRHSRERLGLLADLRQAIDRGELLVHYQPQVDVRSGSLTAVEALVRWPHPTRGLLPPDEFIPLAERTRLIQPLSRWILASALQQCATWRAAGLDVPVSVNLSAYDLRDHDLPDLIDAALAKYGVPPERLRIEITESSLMANPSRAREILARLRAQGVQVSIDDFGIGYSSLAYLKNLPVDELKIDRSFVGEMAVDAGSRAIVRAIIDLADVLGLRVVAEGVEDEATLMALAALGCDVAQGFYFARALPPADLAEWANAFAGADSTPPADLAA
jgi:diguanylate cyclase (GGDEF)-like protein/PAS domain S-box-containing protein